MSTFSRNWEKKRSQGLAARVKGTTRTPTPIKPQLDQAVRQIQGQIARLDIAVNRLKSKDGAILSSVVSALQKHDGSRAVMYANELTELRKMSKMVTQARLALEQIVLRLNTITELGDIVATLAPATTMIRSIRESLSGVLPEAESEMGEISSLLSGILVDTGSLGGYSLNFETANEEAEQALAEAAAVAEQNLREKFPDIPTSISEEGSTEAI